MQKVMGNAQKGMLFVVSAPAGSGKTTLTQMLVDEFPCVIESVSFTTRSVREGEVEGKHYHYIGRQQFEEMIAGGSFLEHATIYGDCYGTSREWVEEKRNQGKHVVLVIDTQGAAQVKTKCEATFIFILPPSFEELRARLTKRRTETKEAIERRLDWARKEVKAAQNYDYIILNDDLETAYQVFKSIFIAEEHKLENTQWEKIWNTENI